MGTLIGAIIVAAIVMLLGIAVCRVFSVVEKRSLLMRYLDSCFEEEEECTDQTSSSRHPVAGYWQR